MAFPGHQSSQGSRTHYILTDESTGLPATLEWSDREDGILDYAITKSDISSRTFFVDASKMIRTKSVMQCVFRYLQKQDASKKREPQNSSPAWIESQNHGLIVSGVTGIGTSQTGPQNGPFWNEDERKISSQGRLQSFEMNNQMPKQDYYGQLIDAQTKLQIYQRQKDRTGGHFLSGSSSTPFHNSSMTYSQSLPQSFWSSDRSLHSIQVKPVSSPWPGSSKSKALVLSHNKMPTTGTTNVKTSSMFPFTNSQLQLQGTPSPYVPSFSTPQIFHPCNEELNRIPTIPNRSLHPSVPFPASGNVAFSLPRPTSDFVHQISDAGNSFSISCNRNPIMPELQLSLGANSGKVSTFPLNFQGKGIVAQQQPSSSSFLAPDTNDFAPQFSLPASPTWNGGKYMEGTREVPVSHASTGEPWFGNVTHNHSGWESIDAQNECGMISSQQHKSQCLPPTIPTNYIGESIHHHSTAKDSFEFSLNNQGGWELSDVMNESMSAQQLDLLINQSNGEGVTSGQQFIGEVQNGNLFSQVNLTGQWTSDQSDGQLPDCGVNHASQVDSQHSSDDANWFYDILTPGESTSSQEPLDEFRPVMSVEEYDEMLREGFKDYRIYY